MDSVWVVYYADMSGIVLFANELDALRHGVANKMEVTQMVFGIDLIDELR